MLRLSVLALLAEPRVEQVLVAVAATDQVAQQLLADLPRTVCVPCGGPTRADTVRNAVNSLDLHANLWVLVHDAARPGLPLAALTRLLDTCLQSRRGGLLALPLADTLKQASPQAGVVTAGGGEHSPAVVTATIPRDGLWLAQTPQMFPALELAQALLECRGDASITDEASAIERVCSAARRPLLVPGDRANIKLTWPADFVYYEQLLLGRRAVQAAQE